MDSGLDKLLATDGSVFKQFGSSVAFSSNTAVIGAIGDGTAGIQSGAAYVFQRDGSLVWHQIDKLTASDGQGSDQLGYAVALSGNTAVVGANQDDDGGATAGSAYLFRDNGLGNWNQICQVAGQRPPARQYLRLRRGHQRRHRAVGAPLANDGTDSGAAYLYAVVAGLAGDYNNNGRVDSADFVVWRNLQGQSANGLAADGNGDGTVNQADYQLWRENIGLSSPAVADGATAAVPEPATIALLYLAAALLAGHRIRWRDPVNS